MDLPVKNICFNQDTKERKRWFKAASFAHPAKMHLSLQMYLIEHYTKPGDTILDPMGGSGTILVACALGRNVILVELEDKFVKMQQDNWQKIQSLGPMMFCKMGKATILKGDARNLDGLLADSCIFSPPYAEAKQIIDMNFYSKAQQDALAGKAKGHGSSKEYLKKVKNGLEENPNNISNLPYGKADAVITSPPYAEAQTGDKRKSINQTIKATMNGKQRGGSLEKYYHRNSEDNIGNLPYGEISAVISSPPYAENFQGDRKDRRHLQPLITSKGTTRGRGFDSFGNKTLGKEDNPNNISNLPYGKADAVITSPPYEGSFTNSKQDQEKRFQRLKEVDRNAVEKGDKWAKTSDEALRRRLARQDDGYGTQQENIGNLKGQSYLQAMYIVYQNCRRVLKEKGVMVLVTKNFIRDKKVVRLDLDTIKLCEQAGFTHTDRLARKLTQQSFWRIIALLKCDHRKNKDECKLGLKCPVVIDEQMLLSQKADDQAAYAKECKRKAEKSCPKYINNVPKLEFEDILVFERAENRSDGS